MELDFAPMEGITTCIFRRVHRELFPGADRYYAPFLAPDGSGRCKENSLRDLLPENNRGGLPVPQILCNRAEAFLALSRRLKELGYEEVNLNAGCPSATVVPKHKGAGMLADLESLDRFLEEVFGFCPLRVSVKTRMGMENVTEFPAILEIYNKYPISLLIIHARDRSGMYRSEPDLDDFSEAFRASRNPVCFNGDLFDSGKAARLKGLVPDCRHWMLGRGAVADPALFRELRAGPALEEEELREFLERLLSETISSGLSEAYALGRMKEIWYYTRHLFPGGEKEMKRVLKSRSRAEYRQAVGVLFSSECFRSGAHFESK